MPEEDKTRTRKVELSRREESVVKAFEDAYLEMAEIHRDDPRERIFHDVVIRKFGRYDTGTERSTPTPMWEKLFDDKICPSCNTPKRILENDIRGRLAEKDGTFECGNCGFRIGGSLFKQAVERHEREARFREEDAEFTKKIKDYKIDGKRLNELAELGEKKAMVRLARKYGDEEI